MAALLGVATHLLRFAAGAIPLVFLLLLPLPRPCSCSKQRAVIYPGFSATQMLFVDNDGLFLVNNESQPIFAFGFSAPAGLQAPSYSLSVVHLKSSTVVWTANVGSAPLSGDDEFVFEANGNAQLDQDAQVVWSTNTAGKGADEMLLQDSGNLVIRAKGRVVWQSFDHPTDTLLSNQPFSQKMRLTSKPKDGSPGYFLAFDDGGDLVLAVNYSVPQPYWKMRSDKAFSLNKNTPVKGAPLSAVLVGNLWTLVDLAAANSKIGAFIWSPNVDNTSIVAVTLKEDGVLSFNALGGVSGGPTARVPGDQCALPESCGPYAVCFQGGSCRCPVLLTSQFDSSCGPNNSSSFLMCGAGGGSRDRSLILQPMDDGVGYFAVEFVQPNATGWSIERCKDACEKYCPCAALFFDNNSGNCFLFESVGSLKKLENPSSGGSSMFVKVPPPRPGAKGGGKLVRMIVIVLIGVGTAVVIAGLVWTAVRIQRRKKSSSSSSRKALNGEGDDLSSDEEDKYLGNLSGMPVRFAYADLQQATDDFSVRLGGGGFGSVYLGTLRDGSRVAVKKLEGLNQGAKEFRAEVTIIGSIHHIHLVRLRGFCVEGSHRLLAYEYMANGSLDRWIFRRGGDEKKDSQHPPVVLDWEKRFTIAVGTAKGLAYLHEDCESKIVHCDIKPENVLLDGNFEAKVSDFGLAKLMTREQSHVFTTMRGTRGYLAPEWITNYAISEKSDVYSFGMVLLEIIGGRKNFDPSEASEKAHFPSYAFRMMEEGRLREVLDSALQLGDDERVDRAIKVALWCIQEDMALRPSMAKVVQMLEGIMEVPQPPSSTQMGFRLYASLLKSMSDNEGGSSASVEWNSEALLSAVRLSGPR